MNPVIALPSQSDEEIIKQLKAKVAIMQSEIDAFNLLKQNYHLDKFVCSTKFPLSFHETIEDRYWCEVFFSFMESEHCEENYLFYQEVESFAKNVKENQISFQPLLEGAFKIFNKYISHNKLNIAGKTIGKIQQQLRNNDLKDLFLDAQLEIVQLLSMDIFPR